MKTLLVSAAAAGFASALVPVANVEVFVSMASTEVTHAEILLVSALAAVGVTVGKLIWYAAGTRGTQSAWMQRRLASEKTGRRYARLLAATQGRPSRAAGMVLLAAVTGLPPLILMSLVAGSVRLRLSTFAAACVTGRFLRFAAIGAGVTTLLG